jgi:ABC-type multidrug transport system fused ATPase/permease subunit
MTATPDAVTEVPRPGGWLARLFGRGQAMFDPAAWRFLWGYFRARKGALALVGLLGVAQSLIFLPTLYLVRYAFDDAVPHGRIAILMWIGAGLVAIRLAASALALVTRAMSLTLTKTAVCEIRRDILGGLYALPRDFFGQNDAARVHTRIVHETERIDNLCSLLLSAILPAALTGVLLLGVLLHLNGMLVLLLTALLPLMWISTVLGGRYVKREVKAFQSAFERFSQGVQFVLRQMELTRVRGYEEEELERQTQGLRQLERSGVRMAMSFAVHGQIQGNLAGIGGLLLLVGGGVAVANHAMTIGELLAFYLAAGILNENLSRVTNVAPELIAGNESLGKLVQLRGETETGAYRGSGRVDFQGRVSVRDVTFGFDGKPLLEKVSLDLAPRTNTAIVGPNGAGKSTIINLILGFYRPISGGLVAEGTPYEDLDLRALRRSIGVVLQKPTFFTGTIAENIAYGWPDIDRTEVEAAARQACADGFIAKLPLGYDTQIGEGGALLSGGEAQRLAIARALIGRPKLLILDEPTNHLDAEAVGEIMGRLVARDDRPGILIISHDPAVTRFSDKVLRLKGRTLHPEPAGNSAAA